MTEREHDAEEQVEDLDVPEAEAEDVKGGLLLNYSKIDAAAIKGEINTQKWNPSGGSGFTIK